MKGLDKIKISVTALLELNEEIIKDSESVLGNDFLRTENGAYKRTLRIIEKLLLEEDS